MVELSRFKKALKPHANKLPSGTLSRYSNGKLPGFGRLLLENPELALALAEDAASLAQERAERGTIVPPKGGDL